MSSRIPPRSPANPLLLGVVLVAAIAAAYALALRGDFLWDDDLHVTANPTIIGPLGLKEIWTTARANYFPLVLTNFWVQHAAWGLNPLGYHIVTLACHAIAAILLWRVLLALRVPGAWLGAALWALHPVQVESVAWICELKNTQSAVFFLLAIWFWVKWVDVRRGCERERAEGPPLAHARSSSSYLLTLACAVLAILSKPSTVMLPVALALCGWWLRRRIAWRDLIPLLPFLALSAGAAGWTIWEQKHHSGAIGPEWSQTLPERIAIAGRVVWFYLGKLAWPEPLIFIYPRWELAGALPLAFFGSIAVVAVLLVLWWYREGPLRGVLFAALYFGALLFPVLGFFSVYFFRYSFVGDHFQYLASMGPLALAGAGLSSLGRRGLVLAGVVGVMALTALTVEHTRVFRNRETLWRDTVAKNPDATMAWLNLADTLTRAQRYDEAMATYRRALRNRPNDHSGWNDLGNVLVLVGRPEEALSHFERAIAIKPNFPDAYSNLGNALRAVGRSAEAILQYRRALELDPKYVEALSNLGAELAEGGKPEEALPLFERALAENPRHVATLDNLGSALRLLNRHDEAIARHQAALRLKPDFAEAEINLGRTLLAAGRAQESLAHFERGLTLKPTLAGVRANYAAALTAVGREQEAFAQLEKAVALSPNSPDAHTNLGVALVQSGRLKEAIARFETAVQLAPQFGPGRANLAMALGSAARWREAAVHLGAAVQTDPRNPTLRSQLAVALVNSDQLEAAVTEFEAALRLEPASAEIHENFAQVLRALRRNREAFEHFEEAARLRREGKGGRP